MFYLTQFQLPFSFVVCYFVSSFGRKKSLLGYLAGVVVCCMLCLIHLDLGHSWNIKYAIAKLSIFRQYVHHANFQTKQLERSFDIAEIVGYQRPACTDFYDSKLNMFCCRRVCALIGSRAVAGQLFYIIYLQTAEVLFDTRFGYGISALRIFSIFKKKFWKQMLKRNCSRLFFFNVFDFISEKRVNIFLSTFFLSKFFSEMFFLI